MIRLKAYKTYTAAGGTLDHTYVWAEDLDKIENSSGKGIDPKNKWGCMGGDKGGVEVKGASGRADISTAIKLAGKDGGHGNGITYAINGVCHNMSNRVLSETRRTVNKDVRGGNASALAYGFYGIFVPAVVGPAVAVAGSWKAKSDWKKRCKTAGVKWKPLMRAVFPDTDEVPESELDLQDMLDSYVGFFDEHTSAENIAVAESKYIVSSALDSKRAEATCEQLAEIRLDMSAGTGAFKCLSEKKIVPEAMSFDDLANKLNAPINLALDESEKIFSPSEYERLFGAAPGEEVALVEPELLKAVYGHPANYVQTLESMASDAD